MPRLVRRQWESDPGSGSHREPFTFAYDAYVPDPIASYDRPLAISLAAEAEATAEALAALQGSGVYTGLEALGRQLLRAESIASSRIEGLVLSQRRLARALVAPEAEQALARSVIGNVRAMEAAISLGAEPQPMDLAHLLAIHRTLFEGTDDEALGGRLRTSQNWIGGSSRSPRGAEFIPPPEDELEPLLADLVRFMARDDMPALIQAAIAHAQFETIHPFPDGNGRVGRALIHVILRRRGMAPRFVPPVSLVLATNATRYVEGLTAYRAGESDGWCLFFVRAMAAAARNAAGLDRKLEMLQADWRERAGHPRRHSAAAKLIGAMPGQAVLDVRTAARLIAVSEEGARRGLNDLTQAGILSPVVLGRQRNRVWEARELLTLLDAFEWELAQPTRAAGRASTRRSSAHGRKWSAAKECPSTRC